MTSVVVPLSEETPTEKWRRRREISSVLKPDSIRIDYAGADYAVDLTMKFRWNVERAYDFNETRAVEKARLIYTLPITDEIRLAAFVHEAGHIENPADGLTILEERPKYVAHMCLESELAAWSWALKTLGRRFTPAMSAFLERCIRSYHGVGVLKTYPQLLQMEALIAEAKDLARHVVRILPANALRNRGAR